MLGKCSESLIKERAENKKLLMKLAEKNAPPKWYKHPAFITFITFFFTELANILFLYLRGGLGLIE